jgi:hypothetical protein
MEGDNKRRETDLSDISQGTIDKEKEESQGWEAKNA